MSEKPVKSGDSGMLRMTVDSPARALLVRLAITFTGVIFLSILALIFWRSATVRPPSNAIEVTVPPEMAGAVAVVEGVGLDKPFTLPLLEERKFTARFFVPPGYYTVSIKSSDGKEEKAPQRELLIPADRNYHRYRVEFTNRQKSPQG